MVNEEKEKEKENEKDKDKDELSEEQFKNEVDRLYSNIFSFYQYKLFQRLTEACGMAWGIWLMHSDLNKEELTKFRKLRNELVSVCLKSFETTGNVKGYRELNYGDAMMIVEALLDIAYEIVRNGVIMDQQRQDNAYIDEMERKFAEALKKISDENGDRGRKGSDDDDKMYG